jgi:hypothetical protein
MLQIASFPKFVCPQTIHRKRPRRRKVQRHEIRYTMGFRKTIATAGGILPEFSKFDCLPGSGTPDRWSGQ